MTQKDFISCLTNPTEITAAHTEALTKLTQKYPYFQSAQALCLKGLKSIESVLYNDALKLTAAHTTERDILFEYITSASFTGHDTATLIQAQDEALSNIKIEAEDVLNPHLFQEKKENAKSNLNKPLNFTENDYYSFQEWLKLTPVKPLGKTVEVSKNNPQKKPLSAANLLERFTIVQDNLKDQLLEEQVANNANKQRKLQTNTKKKPNLAKPFTKAQDHLMTETLAQVYFQQKNYDKALKAYKILILKYPEKSSYFAAQIREIETLKN